MELLATLLSPWQASLEHSWTTWIYLSLSFLLLFGVGVGILQALVLERSGKRLLLFCSYSPQGILMLLASLTVHRPSHVYWLFLVPIWPFINKLGARLLLGWYHYRRPLAFFRRRPGEVLGPAKDRFEEITLAVGPDAQLKMRMAEVNDYLVDTDRCMDLHRFLCVDEETGNDAALRKETLYYTRWFFRGPRANDEAEVLLHVTRHTLLGRLPAASPEAFERMLDRIAMEDFFHSALEHGSRLPEVAEPALWFNEGTPVVDYELRKHGYWSYRVSYIPVGADAVLGLAFTCCGGSSGLDPAILTRFAREQARRWTLEDGDVVTGSEQWQNFQPALTDHQPAELEKLDEGDLRRLFRRHCKQPLDWVAFEHFSDFYFQWMKNQYEHYEAAVTAHQKAYIVDFLTHNLAAIPKETP